MPEPEEPAPKPIATSEKPVPRRPWLRRIFRTLLVLILLAIIFHRPLFHTVVRLVLIKVAARQHLTLDVHFSGNIFTNLAVEGVHARPNGTGKTPVERIDIERVRLDYSLILLAKKGVGEFLRSYEIKNAELIFTAEPSRDEKEKQQKKSLARDLNNLLAQPAAYADRVRIDQFNIVIHSTDGEVAVRGIDILLDPDRVGFLRVASVHVPKMPAWENLSAETSYVARNLYIRGLALAPEIVLDEVNFDASQRAQNKGSMMLKGHFFGGTGEITLAGSQLKKKGENLDKSYDTSLRIEAANVSVASAAAYFQAPPVPVEKLARLSVSFKGEPEKPQTWDGGATVRVEGIGAGGMKIDSVETVATFKNGRADITAGNLAIGKNSVALTATAALPASVNDFPKSSVDAVVKIDAPDLAALTAMMPEPLTGAGGGEGKVAFKEQHFTADLALTMNGIESKQLGVGSATIRFAGSTTLGNTSRAAIENLDGHVTADFKTLRFQTFTADSAAVDVLAHGDLVTLKKLELVRAENSISASGTYRVPSDLKNAAAAPVEGQFSIKAPRLEAFGFAVKDKVLSGHLDGDGAVKMVNAKVAGSVRLDGGEFQLGDFKTGPLAVKIAVADDTATVEEFALKFSGNDQIAASGKVGTRAPFLYEGGAIVSVKDLAIFQPLLAVFGVAEPVKGALQIDWNGKSEPPLQPADAASADHSGDLSLSLTKGSYGKFDLSEIKVAGIYGPGFASTSELNFVTGSTSLAGALEIKEGKLRFRDIALAQGKLTVLTGYIIVPIDLSNLKAPVPLDQRLAANVNAKDLDIEQLLASFGQTAPVSGTFTANIVAGGTALQPSAHLKVAAHKLKSKAAAQFDPAELDLNVHYSQKELTLDSTLRQPQIQPLTIKGHVPLDLDATVKNKKIDPNLPIDLTIKLPPSSLAVVPKLAPAVRRIEGNVGIDVHAGGTVGKPELSGAADMKITSARLANEAVPAIGGFQANLVFAGDTLTFKTFRGEIGGGTFDLGGTTKFPKITEPIFDLKLRAKDVLARRDDSVTVRADTDLKLEGPLAAATASGTVFITNSRFFRDIDILPIGLPGRPKPKAKPRSVEGSKTVSFDKPPLRDWKFDIAIKTRPDDPFRIRGNLANGAAAVDLKLAGTGLQPYLDGNVRVDNFVASLPFSKLTVTRGFIYFTPDEPFQPSLDLQAEANMRDYRIDAYISGNTDEPQVTLTSEPPLAQADIVSLLATGATASELTGNPDVLAGRAAVLVFQQLYRKVFKKNAPSENETLLDRFHLDIGATDSRSGGQEVSATFKLGEQLYLIGEIDVTGGFTGRLKYLLRYR